MNDDDDDDNVIVTPTMSKYTYVSNSIANVIEQQESDEHDEVTFAEKQCPMFAFETDKGQFTGIVSKIKINNNSWKFVITAVYDEAIKMVDSKYVKKFVIFCDNVEKKINVKKSKISQITVKGFCISKETCDVSICFDIYEYDTL